jgi:hypothetical protein
MTGKILMSFLHCESLDAGCFTSIAALFGGTGSSEVASLIKFEVCFEGTVVDLADTGRHAHPARHFLNEL